MRKLLLSLMVLATLASCGKDNKVDTATAVAAAPSSDAITLDDTVAKQLGTIIDNSAYFPAATTSTTAKYAYLTTTVSSAQPSCETKEGWLGIKYTVCKAPINNTNGVASYVQVNSIDVATKRVELKGYINSSNVGGIIFNGTSYTIRTTSGVVYTIDTRYPIQANPVMIQQVSGEIKYFAGQRAY